MTTHSPEFHFSDLELMQAFLASSSPVESESVSEDGLVRYAFGWATETEEERVLDRLTRSGDLRQELIQVRESLSKPEARSAPVREFLDYAIALAADALGALERGVADWKSTFEGNLVVQHALATRSDRLANLPGHVAWARSRENDEAPAAGTDALIVETDLGTPRTLPLSSGPIAKDGEIELAVEFDPHFFSEFADQTLELSFAAGPLNIPLKTWRVSELPKSGRLSAPIPSSLAGPVPRTAIGLSLYAAQ